MNRFSRRLLASAFFASAIFLPLACDSKSSGTSSGESIATNFGISLKSVVAAEGMPDSVVAVVSVDGVAVDTVVPGLSELSDSVIRFPVDAPEGSKVSVTYEMYKGDGVIAAGQVTWVSGDALYIPRPNIAPRVAIRNADAIVRRNAFFVLRTESSDPENKSRTLQIDWDGDGTLDDSIVPPTGRDSVRLSWDKAGTYLVTTWVKDDQGLRRRDTLSVRVVPVATIALSQDTTVSVGDSADVLVSMGYDDPSQATSTRLFWNVDGDTSTTDMTTGRRFAWSKSGTYRVVVKALDAAGEASRDTMTIKAVQDAPKLDLGDFPRLVDLGCVATLPIGVEQSFGTIVRWGMDFDADTTSGWDTTGSGLVPSVQHIFGRSGNEKIFVFVVDDDGNRTVGSGNVSVSTMNAGAVLRRVTSQDTTVSLSDSVTLRFQRSFPEGLESSARMEWSVDGNHRDTTPVLLSRSFAWSMAGSHKVAWRLTTPIGSTSWDTVTVTVKSDAPELVLSSFPSKVDRNTIVTLSPKATDVYGAIVRWGMDFDCDTAKGWDTTARGEPNSVMHVFSKLDTAREILVFVEDDDGNRVVKSHRLQVELGSEILSRTSDSSQRVSIGDTVAVKFQENFAVAGTRSVSRLVWMVDDLAPETLSVSSERRFAWKTPGRHVIRTRLATPYGTSSEDSSTVDVVRDAPVLDLSDLPDTVSASELLSLHPKVSQTFGQFVSWAVDFDGDTSGRWDTAGAGTLPSEFRHSYGRAGTAIVRVRVGDDDGNTALDSVVLHVRTASYAALLLQRASASDTELSVGDAMSVRLRLGADLERMLSTSRLEWRTDEAPSETLSVVDARAFLWKDVGVHVVRFRALGRFGATAWDSMVVHVVRGVPAIKAVNRSGSGVGKIIGFSLVSDPVFGIIVKERWDFGNDGVWDDSSAIAGRSVERVFATSTSVSIRVQVQDDDGNVKDSVFAFAPRNARPAFGSVSFADTAVGVGLSIRVRAAFSDSDGLPDLATLAYDWNNDGVWDTIRPVSGMGSDELTHIWSQPGVRTIRLRLRDQSGDSAIATAFVRVLLDPPVIASLLPQKGNAVARIGDTLWFVAPISDPSDPGDLAAATWIRDGMSDSVISLRGRSELDMLVPVFSRVVGEHSLKTVVADVAGNRDTAAATWRVEAAPPFVLTRLSDSILATGDTAHLILDSLRTGRLGGSLASVAWAYKGASTWHAIPAAVQGGSIGLTLPVFQPAMRDSSWYVVVRVVQDNGETDYDTARADLLESFVDVRTWQRYPVVTIGGTKWMGRNLNWKPALGDSVVAVCGTGENCMESGLRYSRMQTMPGQWMDPKGNRAVSVCPDGWRMPSTEDWESLETSARQARPSGGNISTLLRSRNGWHYLEPPQLDPLRFAALPSSISGFAESAEWWSYDTAGYGRASLFSTSLEVTAPQSGEKSFHVRCVRNTEIIIDSNWRESDQARRIDGGVYVYVHAYVPDSAASVTVRIVADGGVTEEVTPPVGLRSGNGFSGLRIPLPRPSRPGRQVFRLELEQLGVKATDSMYFTALLPTADGSAGVTRIGNQTWMANDVSVDTVAVDMGDDSHFGYHYVPDAIFGGIAPAGGVSASTRGICPEGMHIPSVAEWNTLFDAVRAEGRDPQTSLGNTSLVWANLWPSMAKTTDIYGFGAAPTGRLTANGWRDGSYYWAVDGDGYTQIAIVSSGGMLMVGGPESKSAVAGFALPLRCVGD